MKKIILLLIIMMSYALQSQTIMRYVKDDYLKKNWHKASLMFVAGACDGQVETLQHHYSSFKDKFPNANDNYWNPAISHKNKWENGVKSNGEAFPLSSTALVWTTDAYHAFKMGQKLSIFAAVTIEIGTRKNLQKKRFKHYLVDFIFYSSAYTAGFYTTYGLIY